MALQNRVRTGKDRAMLRVALVALTMLGVSEAAFAQWGGYGGYGGYNRSPYDRPYYRPGPQRGFFSMWGWEDDDFYRRRPFGPRFQSGGGRPAIQPLEPQRISFPSSFPAGSVVIDHKGRQLFFVTSPTEALRYPISVGREGFTWTGSETISRVAEWPDWHPPEEMRERDPSLPEKMSGGIKNPLGAKALYLGSTLYRIHGTNDPKSIGRAASSGCFRMLNGHIVDLAARAQIGTTVTVVNRLPPDLERMVADQVGPPSDPRIGGRSGRSS
jgi:lipoprotein-anchoring transpeptidase ErfK/SrfK